MQASPKAKDAGSDQARLRTKAEGPEMAKSRSEEKLSGQAGDRGGKKGSKCTRSSTNELSPGRATPDARSEGPTRALLCSSMVSPKCKESKAGTIGSSLERLRKSRKRPR